ncbi:MAG: GTP-binding protein [Candidatus Brocadiaceae bacterium]|jgi:small GTP-binding protein
MDPESLAFVLVGHIDHGKSTLIGRLLHDTDSLPEGRMEEIEEAARAEGRELEFGYIVDHLREERERGITIDTAQTFFSSETRDYVIIDAPGHKEFIRNMITGASQAEAVVLICSVAEGVQEQTKRHAYVVRLLGLDQVLVLYNKMDLVDYSEERFREVKQDMDRFLGRLGVEPTLEVPVSAKCGDNVARRSERMPWYDGPTVLAALDRFRKIPPPTEKPLRFPIQDVYDADGVRLAVGRVESGVLESGQRLRFLPGDALLEVSEIKQYLKNDMPRAEAGECVGVRFDGPPPARGSVGCPAGDMPVLTGRFRVSVFWLSPKSLVLNGETITFKCATQERPCRVVSIADRLDSGTLEHLDASEGCLEETEVGEIVFETADPVVLESFYDVQELGRFVLVRDRQVVAGGIVTHPEG